MSRENDNGEEMDGLRDKGREGRRDSGMDGS
jgi:hypothetical protein